MRGFPDDHSILSCHGPPVKAWMAGVISLMAGFCVFVAFGAIALHGYDEKPRPWWLVSMLIIAIGLIAAPLLGFILAALVGLADTFRQHRHGRLG